MTDQPIHAGAKHYLKPVPTTWWLKRKSYCLFMLRELTSVFVGGYAVFLLVLVARAKDPQSLQSFLQSLGSPLSIALHVIALAMAMYHSITWFNLTPKVFVVWRGDEQVRPALIAASSYAAWIIASALVAWLGIRGG